MKKHIKTIFISLILISMSIPLIACSSYDSMGNGNGNGTYPENGVYEYTETQQDDDGNDIVVLLRSLALTDGKYRLSIYTDGAISASYSGTHEVWYDRAGDTIRMKQDGSSSEIIGDISDTYISIQFSFLGDGAKIQYNKVGDIII